MAVPFALGACPASAHPITVDGSPADWPLAPPTVENVGHIARGAGPIGEFIWLDASGDERADFAGLTAMTENR